MLTARGLALGMSVVAYFRDPDNDRLIYTVKSSQPDTVAVSASGSTLWLVPEAAGKATLTIRARDPGGLSATQSLDVTVAAPSGPQGDYAVLAALYDATGGPNWTNWKTTAPLGEWHGVTTDSSGRVTELNLRENGLTGPIPQALGGLSKLTTLRLEDNGLTGMIPEALGNLFSLERLGLGQNGLTGPIPETLGNLAKLEWLYLDENALSGSIPDALGNLLSLEWLDLEGNWGLSGPLPDDLHLPRLRFLDIWLTQARVPVALDDWVRQSDSQGLVARRKRLRSTWRSSIRRVPARGPAALPRSRR